MSNEDKFVCKSCGCTIKKDKKVKIRDDDDQIYEYDECSKCCELDF